MSDLPVTLDLTALDSGRGIVLTAPAGWRGRLGAAVASASDLNGDGIADFAVGAPDTSTAYVVFGNRDGFTASIDLSKLDGRTGFILAGAANSQSGTSISSAGDVNGDGIADLAVGAPGTGQGSGTTHVLFGSRSGFGRKVDLSTLDGRNGFTLRGSAGSVSGWSVAAAGDINGDGVGDLIIGASGIKTSYVVFGERGGSRPDVDLEKLDGRHGFALRGHESAGSSVSSAGDVNGDGIDDIIIGAPAAGAKAGLAYLVFGHRGEFRPTVDLTKLDGRTGFTLIGPPEAESGYSVAGVGDINGDGIADVVVGARFARGSAGTSYVLFGSRSGFGPALDLSKLDGRNGFALTGPTESVSGSSVSSAGDVNGDGVGDLIIGAPTASSREGASYVLFGGRRQFDPVLDLTKLDGQVAFTLAGTGYAGWSVASAGDVNGDGAADVIIGAPFARNLDGAAFVAFGRRSATAAAEAAPPRAAKVTVNTNGGHEVSLNDPAGLHAALGTPRADTLFYDGVQALRLPDTIENVTLSGSGNAAEITGSAQGNTFSIRSGSWNIDGGGGPDTLVFATPWTSHTLEIIRDDAFVVRGPEGAQTVRGVESVRFADTQLTLDRSAAAATVVRLYEAAFQRAPDIGGGTFALRKLKRGVSVDRLAQSFLDSPEGQAAYPPSLTNAQFVDTLYRRALAREPDAPGAQGWRALLAKGGSRGLVLSHFAESAEHRGRLRRPLSLFVERPKQ